MRQKKCFDFCIKTLEDHGSFSGYASVFDVVDHQGDIIKCGAFDITDKDITILWQHKQDEPIGKIINLSQNTNGLYVYGKLITDVKRGYEAHKLLQSGVVNGLSIGYIPKSYKIDNKTGTRIILSLHLIEISLVTFPANKDARISSVKNRYNYKKMIQQIINSIRE